MASRPIQVQPFGLLGFLQVKNLGQNPQVMPDSISPVMEMREWYWETNSEVQTFSSITAVPSSQAVGQLVLMTVPDKEYWAILDTSFNVVTAAGQAISYQVIAYLSGNVPIPLTELVTVGASITAPPLPIPCRDRVFIAPPGCRFGLRISAITTAAAAMPGTLWIRFARLIA